MQKYTKEQIHEKMRWIEYELNKTYNVFYIALYGSQNYWIDTEHKLIKFSRDLIIKTITLWLKNEWQ